ncbi:MAG: type IV pilin protein [Chromatiaceae bacterium]|nr:type IV pilin protein [Gammaproteobacteria bacterium]MCP5426736.1 type IV pilin protein [Chromatiaceae bacterium]MCB1862862.1 type IV pilin protein [Gammaproteobacteria bacterium]MCB1873774.1 type IV pilin protein [Gammaproteobacteria bacterium]MCB1905354.1 type IV pilin protein [Gammaproteobacteria bacterium]
MAKSAALLKRKCGGFTLVELMIAIAVVAILTAIAYPMYQDQVRKSRRASVKGSMLQISQFMERHYTENMRYSKDAGGNSLSMNDVYNAAVLEDQNTVEKYYDLTLTSNLTSYTISAVPGSGQSSDVCANLSLLSTGARTTSSNHTGCW